MPTPAKRKTRSSFRGAALLVVSLATGSLVACGPRGREQSTRPTRVQYRLSAPWLPQSVRRFAPFFEVASRRHGVDANLLAIVVMVESGGDPQARSPAGAIGLMQLMASTARDIAKRRKLADRHRDGLLYDPGYNIDFGAWYLAQQISKFWTGNADATVALAAAAYNGGPGRVRRHLRDGSALPEETLKYQRLVVGMWRERFMPRSASYTKARGGGASEK